MVHSVRYTSYPDCPEATAISRNAAVFDDSVGGVLVSGMLFILVYGVLLKPIILLYLIPCLAFFYFLLVIHPKMTEKRVKKVLMEYSENLLLKTSVNSKPKVSQGNAYKW